MAFEGWARLAFIAPDGTEEGHRYNPGDQVQLDDDTDTQRADIERLLGMGVLQKTDPVGNTEELDDVAPPPPNTRSDEQVENRRTRAQQKLAEKASRDSGD